MNRSIFIRPAVREDFSKWWRGMRMPGMPDRAWGDRLSVIHVAEIDGAVAGIVAAHFVPVDTIARPPSTEPSVGAIYDLESHVAGTWLVNGLAVDRDRQNEGIEDQLLESFERLARNQSAIGLSTVVGRLEPDFVRIFEERGFTKRLEAPGLYSLGIPVGLVLLTRTTLQ